MGIKKLGTIIFIPDARATRERINQLNRVLNAVRHFAELQILTPSTTEPELLRRLDAKTPQLILIPWHLYFQWSRVEALYGSTRTSGPAVAGYTAEHLETRNLPARSSYLRTLLLDFSTRDSAQTVLMIRILLEENRRSGILPMVASNTTVYCENWYPGTRLGSRSDAVLSLPEITHSAWNKRTSAIRLCMNALWSLVYDEGPGKADTHQIFASNSPRAYFQTAINSRAVLFRLFYTLHGLSPHELVQNYWPGNASLSSAAELLLRYADFLRVNWVADTSDVEVVVGLWESSPSTKAEHHSSPLVSRMHSLWISPIATHLVRELPYEMPSPNTPYLKLLPGAAEPPSSTPQPSSNNAPALSQEISELKKQLANRDELIQELRSGGVGTAPPLPPPDMEGLLEAFKERFFEARLQIRQFEIQIQELERKAAALAQNTDRVAAQAVDEKIVFLRVQINALMMREKGWLKQLAATLDASRGPARKGPG